MAIRTLIATAGLLLLGILSCLALSLVLGLPLPSVGNPEDRSETPEDAALEAACRGAEPEDFHIRDTRRLEGASVILYDARCPSPSGDGAGPRFASAAVAHVHVSQTLKIGGRVIWEDSFWDAHSGPPGDLGSFHVELPPSARGPFLSYEGRGVSGWMEGIGNYEYVSGRVLAPDQVAAVEAVLGNGDTIHSDVARGVWVIFTLEARGIREVRALDRDGRVLQRIGPKFDAY